MGLIAGIALFLVSREIRRLEAANQPSQCSSAAGR